MSGEMKPWGFELEEYVRESEPDQAKRTEAWQTAIGLQAVDGLKPSRYLIETAQEHIEGDITIGEAEQRIEGYYRERDKRTESELETEEADLVSSRIARILGERTFSFSPATWKSIHGQLFKGLIKKAGVYRDYNISKNEWVLKGDTVRYAAWDTIKETVDYDFSIEKNFSYKGLPLQDVVSHIARFASGIWQIHPFSEGNTRSTAVFVIKYLNSLGYDVNNQPFVENSWYFRNALVRANYNNLAEGVAADPQFLEAFFRNLLLGEDNALRNRYMHLDWVAEQENMLSSGDVEQVTEQVKKLLIALGEDALSASELMHKLGLRHRPTFLYTYLHPAIDAGLVELTVPGKPNSRFQKYRKVLQKTGSER